MPLTPQDVRQQIDVIRKVKKAIDQGNYRESARLLCEEFGRLLAKRSFWQDIGTEIPAINQRHATEGQQLLRNLASLMDAESEVFRRLEISDEDSRLVLGNVYGSLKIAMAQSEINNPSAAALHNLETALARATSLICREGRGKFQRMRDFIMSWKGVTALAGSATITANVVIFALDGGAISWASVKAGIIVMQGNLQDIVDLLPDDGS